MGPRKHVLGGHIDAVWRIRVNRLYAVAMRLYAVVAGRREKKQRFGVKRHLASGHEISKLQHGLQLIMARYTRIINCRPCCNLYVMDDRQIC